MSESDSPTDSDESQPAAPREYQQLLVEKHGPRLEITIHRPQALNALNRATLEELAALFEDLRYDEHTRVVLVTGAGDKAFVAGADVGEMVGMGFDAALDFAACGQRVMDAIGLVGQIVIAVVNGYALGGGCELALACDFIYASERARFGQPEVKLGVIPGFGGTQRLARRVGGARALELIATGEPIAADEALRLGLVNAVVPHDQLLVRARAVADTIAARAPLAIGMAKAAIRRRDETSLEEGNRTEMNYFAGCFETEDQKEGMKAFLEKRPPVFHRR